jgi:hypothetical protein
MDYRIGKKQNSPKLAGSENSTNEYAETYKSIIPETVYSGDGMPASGGAPGREEDAPPEGAPLPTLDIMWVENHNRLEFGLDYLQFTLYTDKMQALQIYSEFFMPILGDLNYQGEGRLYSERYTNSGGFTFLCGSKIKRTNNHARFEMPGQICKAISLGKLHEFSQACLDRGIRLKCTRLDIRIDGCPFKPFDIAKDIELGRAETRAERGTLKRFDQPLEPDELGKLGTQGMTLGSRESDRFLRIYDKHGFTRFELECKGSMADAYFYLLQGETEKGFSDLAMGLIQDYIRIDADYWREFTEGYERAYMKIQEYKDPTLEGIEKYLYVQVSKSLALLYAIKGEAWLTDLLKYGLDRLETDNKYSMLIHAYGLREGGLLSPLGKLNSGKKPKRPNT